MILSTGVKILRNLSQRHSVLQRLLQSQSIPTNRIVVPDQQLSLAIGKEGQNARLSAKLTGWRIDIKSESQAYETGFITEDGNFPEEELAKAEDDIELEDEITEADEAEVSETEDQETAETTEE